MGFKSNILVDQSQLTEAVTIREDLLIEHTTEALWFRFQFFHIDQ